MKYATMLISRHLRILTSTRVVRKTARPLLSHRATSSITVRGSIPTSAEKGGVVTLYDSSVYTWYSCGPTVYDSCHLGHARTYICTDVVRRILSDYFGVKLTFAMGITDIDDKIVQRGISLGLVEWCDIKKMVRELEHEFFRDIDSLNVLRPSAVLRVTEHIPEIIKYIQTLEEAGIAYCTEDGVYFDVSKLSGEYDKFGCVPPDTTILVNDSDSDSGRSQMPEGSTSTVFTQPRKHNKRSPQDFALWKFKGGSYVTGAVGLAEGSERLKGTAASVPSEPVWASPWGLGRPGWHIECSAMTHSLFGSKLDIHSGGVDLKFPHHTNEIAQW